MSLARSVTSLHRPSPPKYSPPASNADALNPEPVAPVRLKKLSTDLLIPANFHVVPSLIKTPPPESPADKIDSLAVPPTRVKLNRSRLPDPVPPLTAPSTMLSRQLWIES